MTQTLKGSTMCRGARAKRQAGLQGLLAIARLAGRAACSPSPALPASVLVRLRSSRIRGLCNQNRGRHFNRIIMRCHLILLPH